MSIGDEFSTLCEEYGEWLKREGLPEMSADELLHEDVTDDQAEFLNDFCVRWQAMEDRARGL